LGGNFAKQLGPFRQTSSKDGRSGARRLNLSSYLQVAIGSCDEVKLWLEMGKDEGYIPDEIFEARISRYNRIGAMLASLWKNWQGP